jgi:hypothetical protein
MIKTITDYSDEVQNRYKEISEHVEGHGGLTHNTFEMHGGTHEDDLVESWTSSNWYARDQQNISRKLRLFESGKMTLTVTNEVTGKEKSREFQEVEELASWDVGVSSKSMQDKIRDTYTLELQDVPEAMRLNESDLVYSLNQISKAGYKERAKCVEQIARSSGLSQTTTVENGICTVKTKDETGFARPQQIAAILEVVPYNTVKVTEYRDDTVEIKFMDLIQLGK